MGVVANAVVLAAGVALLAGLMRMLDAQVRRRDLPPNSDLGLRTAATKSSPEAWYAGHDAARPVLRAGSAIAAALAVVTLAVGVLSTTTDAGHGPVLAVAGGAYLLTIAFLVVAVRRADGAARSVLTTADG